MYYFKLFFNYTDTNFTGAKNLYCLLECYPMYYIYLPKVWAVVPKVFDESKE